MELILHIIWNIVWVLGVILLLLLLCSLVPVRVLLRYSDELFSCTLYWGRIKVLAYPFNEKTPKSSKTKKEKKPKPVKKTKKAKSVKGNAPTNKQKNTEKAKKNTASSQKSSRKKTPTKKTSSGKEFPELTLLEKTALAKSFVPLILDTLAKLGRYKKINRLEIELLVASEDPVQATLLYGQAHALLGGIWLPLDNALNIQQGRASVRLEYEENVIAMFALMEISLKLGQVIYLALYLLLKSKKLLGKQ